MFFKFLKKEDLSPSSTNSENKKEKVETDSSAFSISSSINSSITSTTRTSSINTFKENFPMPTSPPPLITELKNLVDSFVRNTHGFIKTGYIAASNELVEARFQVCQKCTYYREGRCMFCGCFLKIKLRLMHEKCPLNYW